MSRPARPRRGRAGQDGSVAVVVALSLVVFMSMLAVVIDGATLQTARVTLANATNTAVLDAGEILSQGGCLSYDTAVAAADARLDEHSPTATIDELVVTYRTGPATTVEVDSLADCTPVVLAADQRVGRVEVTTIDSREFAFAPFFANDEGGTAASSSVQWGYIEGVSGRVLPLSLCADNPVYAAFRTFITTGVGVGPFTADLEIDGFEGSPCDPLAPLASPGFQFGEFVQVDFLGNALSSGASKSVLREWMERGSPGPVLLDDPGTPLTNEAECPDEDNDVPGACEGVFRNQSLESVNDFDEILGESVVIMIHDNPRCDSSAAPPHYTHCTGLAGGTYSTNTARGHRSYPIVQLARVRIECLRISHNPLSLPIPNPLFADDLSLAYCSTLPFLTTDASPGDDVFVRLRFLSNQTITEARLTDDPVNYNGFIGMNLCGVDEEDECELP